jgi:Fic family protein
MQQCLQDLEQRFHRDDDALPILVKTALMHYQFEAIHPFRDGNGRVGRLLIPLNLIRSGRLEQPLLYLSAYLERHRDRYMDLLFEVSARGAWMEWVTFFLRGVHESAVESLQQAEAMLTLRERYRASLRGARSFGHLERLIDELFLAPSITIPRAAQKLEVTTATASAHIKRLIDVGVLREWTGRKRGQVFVAPEILAFMGARS